MTWAVDFDIDPNNPDDALVLMNDGHVIAKGDATDPHFDANFNPGIGIAIQVIDWTTPKGYVADGWGGIQTFGGAVHPGSGAWYVPGWNVYRDLTMDPNNNGQGYLLQTGGKLIGVGGLPDVGSTLWPQQDLARAVVMKWDTSGTVPKGAYYILDAYGGIHAGGGARSWTDPDPIGYQAGRDIARGLMVLDWEDPKVYWLEGNGLAHQARFSLTQPAFYPLWTGFSPAMAIRPVSYSPLVYRVLDSNAVVWKVTASSPPTTTITSPTASETVTGTTRPTVQWAVSDAQGDRIDHVTVRLFPGDHAGTDWKTSTGSLWETTVSDTSILGATAPPQPNGDYIWAVWATEAVTGYESDAATVAWTLDATPPAAPTLTAEALPDEPAATLTITPAGSAPDGAVWTIECSDDDGATWSPLAGTAALSATATTWVDRTILPLTARSYRARLYDVAGALDGDWSTVAVADPGALTGWWLTSFDDGEWTEALAVAVKDFAPSDKVAAGVFDPIGETYPVVVRDVPKAADGTAAIWALDTTERRSLEAALLSGRTLLLRNHFGDAWFVAVTDAVTHALEMAAPAGAATPMRDVQTITATWTEVAAPA